MIEFTHVLCPVDFSESSNRSLDHAVALARWYESRLTVLHVVPTFEPMAVQGELGYPMQIRGHMREDAEHRLHALVAAEPRTWCEVDSVVGFGRAHREILRTAEMNSSDLIAMGAQGRGGVGLALFGSTTQQVLRGASCPVLTVRGTAISE